MRSLCVLCVLLSTAQDSSSRSAGLHAGATGKPVPKENLKVQNNSETDSSSRSAGLHAGATGKPVPKENLKVQNNSETGAVAMYRGEIYTVLNSTVLLDVPECRVSDFGSANWQEGKSLLVKWRKEENPSYHNSCTPSTCRLHQNGSLLLHQPNANTTQYTLTVYSSDGTQTCKESRNVTVQAPVSEPLLNVSCLLDGGADIVCRIDAGDDPWFSIMVNGCFLLENSSSSRTVGDVGEVNVTENSPGPWNITCSVRNWVSASKTSNTEVICPVPPSDPVLNLSCLHNGSLQISCSVEIGTDPIFSLSVNEKLLLEKVTKEQKRVNVTLSSPGPWDVQCSVRNHLKEKNQTKTYPACPVPPSDPVLEVSCHNGSLQISCFVEKGTNLVFSLSVNEEILLENTTNEQKRVNVTSSSPGPWDVHCSVRNHLEKKNKRERYVRCPVPLSVPIINASCQNDGTARVVCEVERGSNATYTWSVNRKHIHPSPAPNITINASEFASGAINVTCSAENSVSSEHSSTTEIFCDAPVSDPVLNASCLSNGSAVVTCWILGGTDPKFHLTVNGDVMPFPNMCSSCFGLNYTISTRGPWNISCSVENKISKLMSNISSHSCPVYMESSCLSCFQKSLIGGAVAIIVTTSPLLIAYYYIGRNTKEE